MSVAVRVDPDDPTPPYEQLRRQIAASIQSGQLAAGSRLPTVRQLASDLGIAAGTVARCYRELEAAGLVVTKRAAGTRVASGQASLSAADRRTELSRLASTYAQAARHLGAPDEEIVEAVRQELR